VTFPPRGRATIGESMKAISSQICEAIRDRRVLEFEYEERHRVVHPYCHGFTSKGAESLRAIQVEGETRSGGFGFGKMWTVSKMSGLRVTGRGFVPDDPHYNPDDQGLGVIHCRVER